MKKDLLLLLMMSFIFSGLKAQPKAIFQYSLYDDLSYDDISAVRNKLDSNGTRIMANLNVNSTITFKVHLWHNKENFLAAMESKIGMRYPNSTGYVYGYSEIAVLVIDNPDEMTEMTGLLYNFMPEEIAEHEFAHCVSLHVQSNFANNPRWFWEVVAIHQADEAYNPQKLEYLKDCDYPTIEELNDDFNNGSYTIHQVGYLIGEYILQVWWKDKYIELIKNSGNIQKVLGISNEEFEKSWKDFVEAKYFNTTKAGGFRLPGYSMQYQPTTRYLYVFCGDDLSAGGIIDIFNLAGEILLTYKMKDSRLNLNLDFLPEGIYFVRLMKGDKFLIEKIFTGR